MTTITKTFSDPGTFNAMRAAEEWLKDNGYSVGAGDAVSKKRGILRGDYLIAKFRNLTQRERTALDGMMTGDMREGPVVVTIKVAPEAR